MNGTDCYENRIYIVRYRCLVCRVVSASALRNWFKRLTYVQNSEMSRNSVMILIHWLRCLAKSRDAIIKRIDHPKSFERREDERADRTRRDREPEFSLKNQNL